MKKFLSSTKMLAALLMAGAAFTACSNDDNIIDEQPVPPVTKYTMTVNATKGEVAPTRGLYFDDNKWLQVKWYNTDHVAVFPEAWSWTPLGTLTAAASETGSTTLTGEVTGASVNDNLHLLFPRAEWNYTGQTGILLDDASSIEKKYDYATAQVTVTGVSGNTITTGAANFENQQAIVKFNLLNGTSPLAVDKLTISASSNKLVTKKSYRGTGDKTYYSGNGYYTVTAGSGGHNTSEEHNSLVDNKLNTKWGQNKPDGGWYIEFHTASPIKVDGYMLRTGGDTGEGGQWTRNPEDWVLKGKKNSGESWTIIDTKSDCEEIPYASNAETDFDADVPGEYQYFRLEISDNRGHGGFMQLSEMQLYKYNSYEMGTSYGNITVTPDAAASELTVALRNEKGSADTYTLTANVGGFNYNFTKDNVTFENGKYYAITVKMGGAGTVTWNSSNISDLQVSGTYASYTKEGITLSANADNIHADWYGYGDESMNGLGFNANESGGFTFSNTLSKSFTKIEMTLKDSSGWDMASLGTGWTLDYMNNKVTWMGTAAATVDLLTGANDFNGSYVKSIVFTLQ